MLAGALGFFSSPANSEPLDTAACLHELGLFYHHRSFVDEKDFDKVAGVFHKALTIRKEYLPRSKTAYCETAFSIGWLSMEMENNDTALTYFDEVIRLQGNPQQKNRLLIWSEIGRRTADL